MHRITSVFVSAVLCMGLWAGTMVPVQANASVDQAAQAGDEGSYVYIPLVMSNYSTSLPDSARLSAGGFHTCALTEARGVKCWGRNDYGTLGDGTTTDHATPKDVTGLTSGVIAVSSGYHFSCALTQTGGVKCWGNGYEGELGNGVSTYRTTPQDVTGLTSGVKAIAAGFNHACALTQAGGVKCWGYNGYGGIGDGTYTNRLTPVDVSGLTSGVTAVVTSGRHTCALTDAGGVKCWGDNEYGEIGNGKVNQTIISGETTPVDVIGLTSGVTAIAIGDFHSCALTQTGGVKCWGWNYYGQLGIGNRDNQSTAVDVIGLTSGVTGISTGLEHSCAIIASGGVKCWGENKYGAVGDGTKTDRTTPVAVTGLTSGVSFISGGAGFNCVLTQSNTIKCWGDNEFGQLGDGTETTRTTPVDVLNFP